MYIDDFTPTLANVCENFKPGEVYNIGGTEFVSVEHMSNILLDYLGKTDDLVTYLPEDKHNVLNKKPDIAKAARDFGHDPKIPLEDGVPRTVDWMRSVYFPDPVARLRPANVGVG